MIRAFHPQPTEAAREFHARWAPSRVATLADVWALAGAPTARLLARHARALALALIAAALAALLAPALVGRATYRRIADAR